MTKCNQYALCSVIMHFWQICSGMFLKFLSLDLLILIAPLFNVEVLVTLWVVCLYLKIIHELWRVDYLRYMRTTHGITILYHLHQCRPCTLHSMGYYCAKVGKGGIISHNAQSEMHAGAISKLWYGYLSVRAIIHSLKFVDYLPIQTHKPYDNLQVPV